MAALLLLAVTSSETPRQIVWSLHETIDRDVGNQILLHNCSDTDAICSSASCPFASSRLSVLTGVCVYVRVCVCQVHEAGHTEAHTVGQTGRNTIIPDMDLVIAELEGENEHTCTSYKSLPLALSHPHLTHKHTFFENNAHR